MRLLARKGGWSQHLVAPSGSGMFATIGAVADQSKKCARAKKKNHVGLAPAAHVATSNSLPTVEALSSPSHPSSEARGGSSSLQHVLEEFPKVLNTSKALPKPTHCVQHFLVSERPPVTTKYCTGGWTKTGWRLPRSLLIWSSKASSEDLQQLGFSSPHGEEGRWHVEAMWRLQAAQPADAA